MAILLCSLTLVGDRIFRRVHPDQKRSGLASRIAHGLTNRSTVPREQQLDQMEKIKATLIAFAPIITLVGTIVGAVLSFLGAIYKPK
jgi:biopolymer transport protein ExbB/TolQ